MGLLGDLMANAGVSYPALVSAQDLKIGTVIWVPDGDILVVEKKQEDANGLGVWAYCPSTGDGRWIFADTYRTAGRRQYDEVVKFLESNPAFVIKDDEWYMPMEHMRFMTSHNWVTKTFQMSAEQADSLVRGRFFRDHISIYTGIGYHMIDIAALPEKLLQEIVNVGCRLAGTNSIELWNGCKMGLIGDVWDPIESIGLFASSSPTDGFINRNPVSATSDESIVYLDSLYRDLSITDGFSKAIIAALTMGALVSNQCGVTNDNFNEVLAKVSEGCDKREFDVAYLAQLQYDNDLLDILAESERKVDSATFWSEYVWPYIRKNEVIPGVKMQ